MMFAHGQDSLTTAVEEEWLPYALGFLEDWPDDTRLWEGYVFWDDAIDQDAFLTRTHPLHALGRSIYVECDSDDLVLFCEAPDVEVLRSLHFSVDSGDGLRADQLERALVGLERANLDHLGFAFAELDDDCARLLGKATHLQGLRSLEITSHAISWPVLKEMLSQTQFKSLRHLTFGDVPYEWHPKAVRQLELMEILPELVTTLEPHNAVPRSRVAPSWRDASLATSEENPRTTRQKVESALSIYRSEDDNMYPFLGESFLCFGGFVEISDEDFEQEDLDLASVYPRYAEIAALPNLNITTVYVVAVREGALERSFDEDGALRAPLEFRPMGRLWYDAPDGYDPETYAGSCMLQSVFASFGLYLEARDDGNLWLTPEDHLHESSLVRFWKACNTTSDWVGGWIMDYICTPWNEPLAGASTDDVRFRATVVWEEREHMFDRRGELSATQPMLVTGDAVPLVRILRESGFEVSPGRWEIGLQIEDTHSSANADSLE